MRIPAWDRAGLERLLRYCARPPFALVRLEAIDDAYLRYHLSKPQTDGATELCLSPLELIDRIAALAPPPRVHRHRYHGVLAPNSPLRTQITALVRGVAPDATPDAQASDADQSDADEHVLRSPARYLWATFIARLFEIFPLTCLSGTAAPTSRSSLCHRGTFGPGDSRTHRRSDTPATRRRGTPMRYAVLLRLGTSPNLHGLGVRCSTPSLTSALITVRRRSRCGTVMMRYAVQSSPRHQRGQGMGCWPSKRLP